MLNIHSAPLSLSRSLIFNSQNESWGIFVQVNWFSCMTFVCVCMHINTNHSNVKVEEAVCWFFILWKYQFQLKLHDTKEDVVTQVHVTMYVNMHLISLLKIPCISMMLALSYYAEDIVYSVDHTITIPAVSQLISFSLNIIGNYIFNLFI